MGTNWSGSPVGPFNLFVSTVLNAGNNQQIIAAPGAGLSIYIQSLACNNTATIDFFTGGSVFAELTAVAAPGNPTPFISYPGGFELPTNSNLNVNVSGLSRINVTYAIGPSL